MQIAAEGLLTLQVDAKEAVPPVKGTLSRATPTDGLDVGQDGNVVTGDYEGPFKFTGKIEKVEIQLK